MDHRGYFWLNEEMCLDEVVDVNKMLDIVVVKREQDASYNTHII
jgi:hypothetical protein